MYRDLPNRHEHSNEKPSFWALGYKSVDMMACCVSAKKWAEYKRVHADYDKLDLKFIKILKPNNCLF